MGSESSDFSPGYQQRLKEFIHKHWDNKLGQEVSVSQQCSDKRYYGVLRKEIVDWECPIKGQTIYCVMDDNGDDYILEITDVVKSA